MAFRHNHYRPAAVIAQESGSLLPEGKTEISDPMSGRRFPIATVDEPF